MTRFLAAAALALLAFDALGAEKKKPAPSPEVPLPPVEQLPLPTVPPEQKPAPPAKPSDALPPLARPVRIGVGVAGDLDPASAGRLAASLRSIAALAPLARRSLPIVHEKTVALALRRSEGQLALLTPDEVAQRAVASAELAAPPPRRWTRTAGYVAAGAGIVAAGIAVAEGLHSKSMLDQAESGYRANGNVYRPADLSNLQSGNSAARAANILFAAGGALIASGLVLAFAF